MKKILLFVLSLAPFIVMAQDIDSLYNVYQNARRGEKIETANLLAKAFLDAEIIDGEYHFDNNTSSDYVEMIVNYGMGKIAFSNSDLDLAIRHAETAIAHTHPDSLGWLSLFQNIISVASFYKDDCPNAIESCKKELDILEKQGSNDRIATVYNTIAACYNKMNDLEGALQFSQKATNCLKEYAPDDSSRMAIYLGKQSEILANLDRFDEALSVLNEAYIIDSIGQRPDRMALRLIQKGNIYFSQQEWEESVSYYKTAIELLGKDTHVPSYATALYQLGLAEARMGHVQQAEKHLLEQLEIEKNYKTNFSNTYYALSECYKESDPAKALTYYREYHHLEDSLRGVEKQKQLSEFQVKYDTAEKEKVIEMQKLENRRKSNLVYTLLGIAIMLFITVATTAYFLYLRRRRAKELKEMNDMKDKLISIISHDMKNSIIAQKNVLRMICESFEALPPEVIRKGCLLLKDSASATEELLLNMLQWVSLEIGKSSYNPIPVDLSQIAEQAIKMVNAQAETKGVTLTNEIATETIAMADTNIIGTTLRNLLTNAIKFSTSGKTVRIAVTDAGEDQYQIAVIDQGTGMSENKLNEITQMSSKSVNGTNGEIGTGMGLFFCLEMLKRGGSQLQFESTLGEGTIAKFNVMKK